MGNKNVIIFGPPGCGKGTQSKMMVKNFDLLHLSTGDILREEISNKTELGITAKNFLDKGELVTDSLVNEMVKSKIMREGVDKSFLFDGYPRTIDQAKYMDAVLKIHNKSIDILFVLIVPDNILIQRILERGKTSKRSDDRDVTTIKNRLKEYEAKTSIIEAYYSQVPNVVHKIDGNKTIDKVFASIRVILES